MAHEWDATTYDRLPLPHERWGRRTLARLALTGTETVLDAGAGTGRDTVALLEALPDGRVIALDGSEAMLAALLERLSDRPDLRDRLTVVRADLSAPLPLTEQVDAVFSVATFHWIPDHEALFANLAAVLRPGGQLVFDCGGHGNIAAVEAVIGKLVTDRPAVWPFATAQETAARLTAAGFVDVVTSLDPDPTRIDDPDVLRSFLETIILGADLLRLPEDERAGFVHAVAERLPEPVIDYVRLTGSARRAG
ncbi:methyltransferase domain-containing protein [Frankia sp. CNm7]|uniref:Methyltransferase domain-containing protein n=1 Tax=Frankia nepalensis TaxID=1836974 RepID=A0A937RSW2_9ACTN|nr:class I SAM-dependent methyltransferase [Frankia nepalensis]MBL7497420.1 methyltransferase domain-containing protein [Frankia nepalensis]MBL7512744.1 methyltransferase domain-containing protein [Frankia nepalensis]MBL7522928.1 methyltransferase domain-containing protein [Frankia nepalensis]MBL7632153.1 methyltransferase domain-containing protein [Frankia nepalensis]